MDPIKAKVLANQEMTAGIFHLRLKPVEKVKNISPGRFFMLGSGEKHDPLLRRPLSYFNVKKDADGGQIIGFIYEVRGRGTKILSETGPENNIDFIGPLGNGWDLDAPPERVIFVAGGVGAVPLYGAANSIKKKSKIDFIYGARSSECLVMEDHIKNIISNTHICTDDGSSGQKAFTTNLLEDMISGADKEKTLILSCGPRIMMKETARIAEKYGVDCQVSLEARMGCGLGACLTCVVKGKNGKNVRVCKEGPVFYAKDIDWEALDDNA